MAIDAIAVLPLPVQTAAQQPAAEDEDEEGWPVVVGAGGVARPVSRLRDALLVNLAMPIQADDGDLYNACRQWAGTAPARVWVFPDTAVPEAETAEAVRATTVAVGRWVRAGKRRRTLLEDFGFTPEEADVLQRDISSPDEERFRAAKALLEQRLAGRDPSEIRALIAASLKR